MLLLIVKIFYHPWQKIKTHSQAASQIEVAALNLHSQNEIQPISHNYVQSVNLLCHLLRTNLHHIITPVSLLLTFFIPFQFFHQAW